MPELIDVTPGTPEPRPFICCGHCDHDDAPDFVHALGCFDPFCTGYDERTPRNA